ncbi:hypothetical protein [Bacillus cereus]|uniref:hypothetical protein n=1 Tax=Bacillus cereus TaxID=1396 RepID=UPI000B4A916E|nr:hypothetical protein [Bacillus cereus]
MRKLFVLLAASSLLLQSSYTVLAAENIEKKETKSLTTKFKYESLILEKEKYDGQYIIRYFKYKDTNKPYIDFIKVPESISNKVKNNKSNPLAEATAYLAASYDKLNNLQGQEQLLIQFIKSTPGSRISVSDEYGPTIAENLSLALDYINNEKTIKLTDIEKQELSGHIQDKEFTKYIPHTDKEQLYVDVQKLIDKLEIHWYENPVYYVLILIIVISAGGVYFYSKRR